MKHTYILEDKAKYIDERTLVLLEGNGLEDMKDKGKRLEFVGTYSNSEGTFHLFKEI